jgi:hypothetical protein
MQDPHPLEEAAGRRRQLHVQEASARLPVQPTTVTVRAAGSHLTRSALHCVSRAAEACWSAVAAVLLLQLRLF